jgi:hypothetical protein
VRQALPWSVVRAGRAQFGSHRKGHSHDFALDTVIELPVAFHGVDTDALLVQCQLFYPLSDKNARVFRIRIWEREKDRLSHRH